MSFRDSHDKLVLTLDLFFIAFSGYFCILIFPRCLSYDLYLSYICHTYGLQLVGDNVSFMLLNITDHSIVIEKLWQDKSGQALWYFRYIFISKDSFCVLMVQIADSPLCSSNQERYFCVSFWYVLESDVFIITTNLGVSFSTRLEGFFYQRKGHICYCYRITEFISRM